MLDIKLPTSLRLAKRADLRQVAEITVEGFSEDPINLWIAGNARALSPIFTVLARSVYLERGICHLAGDAGAAMWALSDTDRNLPTWPMLQLAAGVRLHGSRGAVQRAIGAGAAMDANHPKARHLYLFTIATRKAARGQGVGKALMAPALDAADRAGLPVYLENSNPANTGFYVSHGFERMKMFAVGEGSPELEAMWREPR